MEVSKLESDWQSLQKLLALLGAATRQNYFLQISCPKFALLPTELPTMVCELKGGIGTCMTEKTLEEKSWPEGRNRQTQRTSYSLFTFSSFSSLIFLFRKISIACWKLFANPSLISLQTGFMSCFLPLHSIRHIHNEPNS